MQPELIPYDQLMEELACERYAPALPVPRGRYQPAGRATAPTSEPRPARKRRRSTGTGWPA